MSSATMRIYTMAYRLQVQDGSRKNAVAENPCRNESRNLGNSPHQVVTVSHAVNPTRPPLLRSSMLFTNLLRGTAVYLSIL